MRLDVGARGRLWLDWTAVLIGAVVLTVGLGLLGVPSPALFGGLVAGLVRALAGPSARRLPRQAMNYAQAVIGVAIGALVDLETLRAIGAEWLPVLAITVGTLVASLVAGQVMRLQPGVSAVTGGFSMIAGGAAGVVAMSRELGADEGMVAVLQYLRVLFIVLTMPVVASLVYGASGADDGCGGAIVDSGWPAGLLFTVGCAAAGLLLGWISRAPVGAVLGPVVVATVVVLTGLSQGAEVPRLVQEAAFLVIGLQVGIAFTRASLRTVGRALPLALALIVALVLACAGLGAVLAATTDVTPLDAYLATTPGGLYAVLATATGSGANATFVLAVQVLRLIVMVFTAPLVARLLRPRG